MDNEDINNLPQEIILEIAKHIIEKKEKESNSLIEEFLDLHIEPKNQFSTIETKSKLIKIKYTPDIADSICELVANGGNLNRIGKMKGFPSEVTLRTWLMNNPDFATKYARAREARAEARSDRIDIYKRRLLRGEITSEQARIAIDAEKWQAGKESPKKYGDSTIIRGDKDNPIEISIANRLDKAMKVVNPPLIEHEK